MVDKFGREIMAGDLLKIPHYTSYTKRRVYMYKLVFRVDDDGIIAKNGKHLYAVDIPDIFRIGVAKSFKCPISVIDECEIIDSSSDDIGTLFWERPRAKNQEA